MGWLPTEKQERKTPVTGEPVGGEALASRSDGTREKHLNEIKRRLHRTLVERLDIATLETMEESLVAAEIRRAVLQLLAEDPFPSPPRSAAGWPRSWSLRSWGWGRWSP